jgi:hypothetical protein
VRIAVLSDIHGVLPALEAVLAEPDVQSADRIRTVFDVDAAIERIAAESGFARARAFAEEYLRGTASDVDALDAFRGG